MTTEPSPGAPPCAKYLSHINPLSLRANPWGRIHFAHFTTRKLPHKEVKLLAKSSRLANGGAGIPISRPPAHVLHHGLTLPLWGSTGRL